MKIIHESIVEWSIYSNIALILLLSQYFDHIGFSPIQIGILIAVRPLMSLITNPFWFRIKQRIGNTKTLCIMTLFAAIFLWSIFLLEMFPLKLAGMIVTAFFLTSVIPIAESYIMVSLMKKGEKLDRPRLWGTTGFAFTSLLAGFLFRFGFYTLFILASFFLVMVLIFSLKLDSAPVNEQTRQKTSETGQWQVFLFMLISAGLAFPLMSFYSTFLPVLVRQRGYDIATVGICFAIMAFSEVPFLGFAEKILKKTGNFLLLSSGVFIIGFRVLLTPFTTSATMLIVLQVLHGWTFIVIYYSLFNYIHYHLPESQSIKAQTLFWMTFQGFSLFTGSFFGGYLLDYLGLEKSYYLVGLGITFFGSLLFTYSVLTRGKLQVSNVYRS